jgi:hypothetical protein
MTEKINNVVEWENIEAILLEHYGVGRSKEGAYAFPPLLLMKCMLLQKWFHIPSDPELENQINDRMCGRARWPILAGEAHPGRLASHRVTSPWIDGSNPRD